MVKIANILAAEVVLTSTSSILFSGSSKYPHSKCSAKIASFASSQKVVIMSKCAKVDLSHGCQVQ